ncbi:MAG: hydrogenase iron-sulfur subunit [Deltaproteobacteria bacterium]|nr:hydrogenase iron-sulfur subunit [Deltaproteobacteria bacterium]
MFNPKIVAFCCEQSGIPASEMGKSLPGGTDLKSVPHLEIRPVPCAGRIETVHLLTALEQGADGVLVFACHEENCQYRRGNIRAKSRLMYAGTLLSRIGMEKARLEICNLATNSGVKFREVLTQKVDQLRKLGPNKFAQISSEVGKE